MEEQLIHSEWQEAIIGFTQAQTSKALFSSLTYAHKPTKAQARTKQNPLQDAPRLSGVSMAECAHFSLRGV